MTYSKLLRPAALALALFLGAASAHGAPGAPGAAAFQYPDTYKGPVTDTYFGTTVPDPYRWLEADVRNSDSVATWVDEEDRIARDYLAALPQREAIGARIKALWNYERQSAPTRAGDRYFFTRNDGLQNQAVIMVQDGPLSEARVLLDPNLLSEEGTTALAGWTPSPDGKWLAWGVSQGGTDWQEWQIRNVDSIQDEPGTTQWLRYSGVSWKRDNTGYYYSRYDAPPEGTQFTGRNKFHKVYFHKIGEVQSKDRLIYEKKDQPEWLINAGTTEDGRWLILSISMGGQKNRLYVQDLAVKKSDPVPVIDEFTASYSVLGNDGPLFYVKTDDGAPLSRVVTIDVTKPGRDNWTTIVPESTEALRSASFAGDQIFLGYLKDASSEVRVVDREGKAIRTLELPGIGVVSGLGARRIDTENFYTFANFISPPTIYRMDLVTGGSEIWRETKVDFDASRYEVHREFITSTDGARVPLFLAHRKGLKLDGMNPTLLYVYGGFNQPQLPSFTVSRLAWMEMGGVFALVCARGGGEYGRAWHEAAIKLNKQKTFDDVIAAGEWLQANRYTTPAHLGLQGGSNGGMVVGAVTNQRPDLFGAVLAQAGVMDMLRYHQFTIGRAWSADYGLAENEDEFKALYAYSPYHNVRPGTHYPAILVTTSDFDDRVVPGHSFKYAAALQAAQVGKAPVMIRISRSTGHNGRMKPTMLAIEESADLWAFLAANLGMKPRS